MGDRPASSSRLSVEKAARILSRLAHRFADREAILWRAGLDETRWSAMEHNLLHELDVSSASEAELAHFARLYLEARAELTRVSAPLSTAVTTRRPHSISSDDAVPTLPRGMPLSVDLNERFRTTANFGTPAKLGSVPPSEGPTVDELEDPSTDDDPLSATLHSDVRGRRAPPRSR